MAKTKGIDFAKLTQPQTRVFTDRMFNGEEASLELRKITGMDELLKFRTEALKLSDGLKEFAERNDDAELTEADMSAFSDIAEHFVRILKAVVVLPEGTTLTDEEWQTLAANFGGVGSKLYHDALLCVGLGAAHNAEEVKQHLPFSSRDSQV